MTQNRSYSLNESEEIKSHNLMMRTRDSESQDIFTIYVEGPSDEVFYKSWLKKSGLDKKLSILIFDVEKAKNISLEGDGNCGRIIGGAEKYSYDDRKLFIADRDLREESEIQKFAHLETLFFTEFPAIESYGFSDAVLEELNHRKFDNCYKSLSNCYEQIAQLLKLLYFVRRSGGTTAWNRGYETMSKLILNRSIKDYISSEEYDEMMHETIKSVEGMFEIESNISSFESGDPRKYAYGHDVAKIIKCLIVKEEGVYKKSYPTYTIHHLETAITNIYIDMELYEDDQLFKSMLEYINSCTMVNLSI